jgi:hypothetical protein
MEYRFERELQARSPLFNANMGGFKNSMLLRIGHGHRRFMTAKTERSLRTLRSKRRIRITNKDSENTEVVEFQQVKVILLKLSLDAAI